MYSGKRVGPTENHLCPDISTVVLGTTTLKFEGVRETVARIGPGTVLTTLRTQGLVQYHKYPEAVKLLFRGCGLFMFVSVNVD